jgi:hypothetical protein
MDWDVALCYGFLIPMTESRASKISREGIEYGIVWILDIVVKPIKVFVECVGIIMDIQVPLLVIDWRGVSIMSIDSQTCRATHLTLNIAME